MSSMTLRGVQLAAVLGAHAGAMMLLEGMDPWEAVWLTLTTATTVGYGDNAAKTAAGQMVTIVLLYGYGVFLLASIGSEWLEHRARRGERRRAGAGGAKEEAVEQHLVVVGIPQAQGAEYLAALAAEAKRTEALHGCWVEVVGTRWEDGLPKALEEAGVGYTRGERGSAEALRRAGVGEAKAVLVLAEEGRAANDVATQGVVARVRALAPKGAVVGAECVDPAGAGWLRAAGADVVVRAVRAYPELSIRALCAPGTEQVLEAQMTQEGARTVRVELEGATWLPWGRTVAALVQGGAGTPIGYVNAHGGHASPGGQALVEALALVVLEGPGEHATAAKVQAAVREVADRKGETPEASTKGKAVEEPKEEPKDERAEGRADGDDAEGDREAAPPPKRTRRRKAKGDPRKGEAGGRADDA